MRSVPRGPLIGTAMQILLLAGLSASVGLGPLGWGVGLATAAVLVVLLSRSLHRGGVRRLGPADRVTLTRASLVVGVAALVADSFREDDTVWLIVALSTVALALDAVDGRVARRTGTVSSRGARFDMEVDAYLILVLSVYVAHAYAWWALAIGLARYVYVLASYAFHWVRRPLPPRYWRKVVAAIQGIVLTAALPDVFPRSPMLGAVAVALLLLAESFGRDVVWLWRRRSRTVAQVQAEIDALPVRTPRPPLVVVPAWVVTAASFVLVWVVLLVPDDLASLTAASLLRIPVEGLVLVALLLLVPRRARDAVAVVAGLMIGLVAVVTLLDLGFLVSIGRPFSLLTDLRYLSSAVNLLISSFGQPRASFVLVGLVGLAVVLVVVVPLAVLRVARALPVRRQFAARGVVTLGVAWILLALTGFQLVPGSPIAAVSAATVAESHAVAVRDGIEDHRGFAAIVARDAFRSAPAAGRLAGLRGKDVLLVFVESYGRVALTDPVASSPVLPVLRARGADLAAAGFQARSGYLTSPTFGGISWLAHATLESGLRIGDQQRYDDLIVSDRLTLARAFADAGWRTVADVPSNERPWPEGQAFYGFDHVYDEHNVGYAGPTFGYASMPDQYTIAQLAARELTPGPRARVMAEVDLVSSHTPWAPLPQMVPWSDVGDGSVFGPMPAQGQTVEQAWADSAHVRDAYGRSIAYSLDALLSFVASYGDPNLVVVLLGDHQPAAVVTGGTSDRDVPVTLLTRDPQVLARTESWQWAEGLVPGADAPVWPMEDLRDRFLAAFGTAAQ